MLTKGNLASAPQIMEQMIELPTLDLFLDRNPKHLSDDDLRHYIDIQRQRRTMYIDKEQDK